MVKRIWHRRGKLGNDGVATLEFALVSTFLCTLVIGLCDFGLGFWQYMQVQHAVQAGANYAVMNGFNSTGITNAVTNATGLSGLTMTTGYPKTDCGCPNGSTDAPTGMTFGKTCGSACGVGGSAQKYILIQASANDPPLLAFPGLPNPVTLSASAYVFD
jgi:Flp pilus assembly protein TadG